MTDIPPDMLRVVERMKASDFVFTAEACGTFWDVYTFRYLGRPHTLAWRLTAPADDPAAKCEIGFFKPGRFTERQIVAALTRGQPS